MMYRLYIEKCRENGEQFVKQHFYQDILNTKFNLSFFRPKKDQCSICESYKNSSEEEKNVKLASQEKHRQECEWAHQEKSRDKTVALSNDKDILLCSFDLQAVMPLPYANASTFYYKSKLNVYNFTVYNIPDKKGFCYMWHEGEAKRGACEIATCIYNFLQYNGEGKHDIFYSDNCAAQNKNKFLVSMYLYVVENLNVQKISHKFLIVGHTENEGDSMHSTIEKERNRVLRSNPIYVPSELYSIAKTAKKTGSAYIVREMSTEDFIDWKKVNELTGKNFNINEKNQRVQWNEIKMLEVRKEQPLKLFYKTSYEQSEYEVIDVVRKCRGRRKEISLHPLYNSPPSIPSNKKNDLISLCKENLIPKKYHNFFSSLKSCENNDAANETECNF
ncbi:uncharacterized protein LOC120350647 [Nilaparvata lugens]|uniref:uncharacterized protein LOC120350647 n=1 Tax=Nilaparvata lugens TaxID=108931 RepID=UPI00193CCD2C|nr:uncharacterized protein LOC120350647 [Nilaparvata lugens]